MQICSTNWELWSVKDAEVNSPKGFCSNRVHTCKIAMDAVEQNGYELIPHPAYSPDFAPSDYFLFPNLKKDIRGRHFRSNEEVVAAVEEWVRDKDPGFFSSELMALEHHLSKCIILEGNYIEKKKKKKKRSISPRNKVGWFFIDSPSLSHTVTQKSCSEEYLVKNLWQFTPFLHTMYVVGTHWKCLRASD